MSTVNLGLGIGCLLIAALMAIMGGWFIWSGLRDRDWSSVGLSIIIFAVAAFACISAYKLFTAGIYVAP